MRILVVANDELVKRGGSGIRSRMAVEALSRLGDVQMVSVAGDAQHDWLPVAERPGVQVRPVGRSPSLAERLLWPVQGRSRGELHVDFAAEQAKVAAAVDGPIDLVWAITQRAALSTPPDLDAPMITDLIDWDGDLRVARGLARARHERTPRSIVSAGLGYLDRRARRQLFARAGARSAFLLVCTDEGRRAMGLDGVEVLENAYPAPDGVAPHRERPDGDVVLFVGSFNYGPNADGARWVLDEVLPRLRSQAPSVALRLVGRGADALDVAPGLSVSRAADVPDLSDDLAAASVCIAPLRQGSGSRIKILEAFAHGIPVVSTTVGAEGLAVRDGEHLLVADDPDGFARACARLLTDAELVARLTAAARTRYEERYSDAAFASRVAELVAQTTTNRPPEAEPVATPGPHQQQ